MPDHLNPKLQGADAPGEEDASGGVLIWNTGIAEVELPDSFAHQTAAATERALRREADARSAKSRLGFDSSALPANFSADFDRHRSEFVAELKSMNRGALCCGALSGIESELTGGLLRVLDRGPARAWLPQGCVLVYVVLSSRQRGERH